MRWGRRKPVDQFEDGVFHRPHVFLLIADGDEDLLGVDGSLGDEFFGALEELLEHLLLASQVFLPPNAVLLALSCPLGLGGLEVGLSLAGHALPLRLHLSIGRSHLGEHFVLPLIALFLPLIALLLSPVALLLPLVAPLLSLVALRPACLDLFQLCGRGFLASPRFILKSSGPLAARGAFGDDC